MQRKANGEKNEDQGKKNNFIDPKGQSLAVIVKLKIGL